MRQEPRSFVTPEEIGAAQIQKHLASIAQSHELCAPLKLRHLFSFDAERPFEEQSQDVEGTFVSPLGTVSAWTSAGGPYSKYGDTNEDAYGIFSSGDILHLVLADGAGGSASGKVASRLSVVATHALLAELQAQEETWMSDLQALRRKGERPPLNRLQRLLVQRVSKELMRVVTLQQKANREFFEDEGLDPDTVSTPGIYGTVAGVLRVQVLGMESPRTFVYARGDTRVIQLRGDRMVDAGTTWFLNKAGYDAAARGDAASYWKNPDDHSQLLAALGTEGLDMNLREEDIALTETDTKPGDVFLLIGDGIGDIVTDYEIRQIARSCMNAQGLVDDVLLLQRIRVLSALRNASAPGTSISLQLSETERTWLTLNEIYYAQNGKEITLSGADNQTALVLRIPNP